MKTKKLERYFAILQGKEKAKFLIAKKSGILAEKIKKAYGILKSCELCERKCRVNRLKEEKGFCGITTKWPIFGAHMHYGEEPELVPSATLFEAACDMRCVYCFLPDTIIPLADRIIQLKEIFDSAKNKESFPDGGSQAFINETTFTHTGSNKKISKVFRHKYNGKIVIIQPNFFPLIKCTPYHKFFVWNKNLKKIEEILAEKMTTNHYLIVPKKYENQNRKFISTLEVLSKVKTNGYKKSTRKLTIKILKKILGLHKKGFSTRKIAKQIGLSHTYVRYIITKSKQNHDFFQGKHKIVEDNDFIRFTGQKGKIPKYVRITSKLGKLLGYYCAEGSVYKYKNRPNSYRLVFTFGKNEILHINETRELLEKIFKVKTKIIRQERVTRVEVGNTSCALFFKLLCGNGASNKAVPGIINTASKTITEAFLSGYIAGDGCLTYDKKVPIISTNTVSQKLALGIFWSFLKVGKLPRFFMYVPPKQKKIGERKTSQSILYYVKVREKNPNIIENEKYWFIPIKKISEGYYSGYVYNLEVEKDHSYLANFVAVKNCQNAPESISPELGKVWSIDEVAEWIEKMYAAGAKNINFVGGEPTPFIPFIFEALSKLKVNIPIVFNSNAYYSEKAAELLKSVVDVYLLDFRYFDEKCAVKLSSAPRYPEVARRNFLAACKDAELIIRVLVLPNHIECDAKPIIRWIAENLGKNVRLNILEQYWPAWQAYKFPEINKRLSYEEYKEVVNYAKQLGMKNLV